MTGLGVRVAVMALVATGTTSAQQPSIAITDVTVIDGTGAPARPQMTVVISGGRISVVDATSRATIPSSAQVIDGGNVFDAAALAGLLDASRYVH